jgi:hypothetical protein
MAKRSTHTTEGSDSGLQHAGGSDAGDGAQSGGDYDFAEVVHQDSAGNGTGANGSAESSGTGDDSKKKPVELKRADFARLVNNRMSNAVDAIRRLANCANKQSYEWTPEQQDEIFKTLRTAVETTEKAFVTAATPKEEGKRGANKQLSFRLSSA